MGMRCSVYTLSGVTGCSALRGTQWETEDGQELVTLNIYDLGESSQVKTLNRFLQRFGTGAFHCGVEVFGREWSYSDMGDGPNAWTGVFGCLPKRCEDHTFSSSVDMGRTFLRESQMKSLLTLLREEWFSREYDAIHHNCCHFCDELCVRLGVGNIPLWVRSLAGAGEALENRAGEVMDCRCCVMIADGAQQNLYQQKEGNADISYCELQALPECDQMQEHEEHKANSTALQRLK